VHACFHVVKGELVWMAPESAGDLAFVLLPHQDANRWFTWKLHVKGFVLELPVACVAMHVTGAEVRTNLCHKQ
jgi:hypothetical protein